MSESEEDDNFELYGTQLEPLDEDTIPKKKAFSIEDQVATDEQGRRRFHGAFTGGFSAGFFNTVGSLEGWKPSEFKSSRSEKADKKLQKPEDFMDDEDTGQFGIAPKKLKATSDYSQINKRKRTQKFDGPIPGDPVLFSLLEVAKDTVGVRLLKKMGWKPGQGVGPRLSKREKIKQKHDHKKKIYGCEIPNKFRSEIDSDESSNDSTDIKFAPDDYDAFIYKPKDNTFGIGYVRLGDSTLKHINLFDEPEFRLQERNNKKLSITGQAFGVGAFENEDSDIYSRDDMSKYDFELETPGKKNKTLTPKKVILSDVLEGFVPAKTKTAPKKIYIPPEIPKNFVAKHGVRISRFEPLPENHKFFNYERKNTGRHDLKPSDRSKIINSDNITISKTIQQNKILSSEKVKTNIDEDDKKILLEKAKKITEGLTKTDCGTFKPFMSDPDKQNRYEIYLTLIKHNQKNKLADIQPPNMSDWEKSRETNEFDQAARLFKPSTGLIFDKFVSSNENIDIIQPVNNSIYEHGTPEMREAVKKKLFGPLTRVILPWNPHKLLCRRFNVVEPKINDDINVTEKRKNKFNIFDYYEAYQQNKTTDDPKRVENNEINISKDESIPSTSQDVILPTKEGPSKEKNDQIVVQSLSQPLEEQTSKIPPNILPANELKLNKNVDNLSKMPKNEENLTVPTDPKAKKDLFKAIFLSSESENESENDQDNQKFTEMKKIVEESVNKKTETITNRFENKGFFSDLDLTKLKKSEIVSQIDKNPEKIDLTYGPKLPVLPKNLEWRPTFQKPNKAIIPAKNVSSSDDDSWVEVDKSKKKDKKDKKHKKHKEKHKKHKSKHKKRK